MSRRSIRIPGTSPVSLGESPEISYSPDTSESPGVSQASLAIESARQRALSRGPITLSITPRRSRLLARETHRWKRFYARRPVAALAVLLGSGALGFLLLRQLRNKFGVGPCLLWSEIRKRKDELAAEQGAASNTSGLIQNWNADQLTKALTTSQYNKIILVVRLAQSTCSACPKLLTQLNTLLCEHKPELQKLPNTVVASIDHTQLSGNPYFKNFSIVRSVPTILVLQRDAGNNWTNIYSWDGAPTMAELPKFRTDILAHLLPAVVTPPPAGTITSSTPPAFPQPPATIQIRF